MVKFPRTISFSIFPSVSDEPEAPGKPEIVDTNRDRIDFKWEAPENDGGAPITGYIIERREPRINKWVKITNRPVPGLDYTDGTVTAMKEYQYRVIAVNKAGNSPASEPSDLVVAKPMRGTFAFSSSMISSVNAN